MTKPQEPSGYVPPFTVSAEAINLVAGISAQIERYAIRLEQADGLRLRKANRIKTIHSSLAIEGNTLTEDNVRDLMEGKTVVAPLKQIQEVRNAIQAYELYPTLDAFREKDLLRAHGIMMQALVDNAGHYRSGNVGVFGPRGLEHLAPPAARVPQLMSDLFRWLKTSKDHLLIRSCVFHYEFEFIHPFMDGNGRMGRLWQSLILGKLNPVFAHLPVENMVYANQQQYYDAIHASTVAAQSGSFIDFMLREIYQTLKAHQGEELPNVGTNVGTNVGISVGTNVGTNDGESTQRVLAILREKPTATARQVATLLGLSQRQAERLIATLRQKGLVRRVGPNKGGHWEVNP